MFNLEYYLRDLVDGAIKAQAQQHALRGALADRCQHSLPEASKQDLPQVSSELLPSRQDLFPLS